MAFEEELKRNDKNPEGKKKSLGLEGLSKRISEKEICINIYKKKLRRTPFFLMAETWLLFNEFFIESSSNGRVI